MRIHHHTVETFSSISSEECLL
jgi:hypothetical protein